MIIARPYTNKIAASSKELPTIDFSKTNLDGGTLNTYLKTSLYVEGLRASQDICLPKTTLNFLFINEE
jgi:hypothetical protein